MKKQGKIAAFQNKVKIPTIHFTVSIEKIRSKEIIKQTLLELYQVENLAIKRTKLKKDH